MSKVMVEMVEDYWQYATLIDNRKPISIHNVSYSIYPHRAIDGAKLPEVIECFSDSDFKFKVVD